MDNLQDKITDTLEEMGCTVTQTGGSLLEVCFMTEHGRPFGFVLNPESKEVLKPLECFNPETVIQAMMQLDNVTKEEVTEYAYDAKRKLEEIGHTLRLVLELEQLDSKEAQDQYFKERGIV